jgi:hypothetical protein
MMTLRRRAMSAPATVCLGLAIASAAWPARAQNRSSLPAYSELRQTMMAQGWKPDAQHGLKLSSGKPLYKFPEVLCGPEICSAKWVRAGDQKTIMLLRGYGSEEHRVTSQ